MEATRAVVSGRRHVLQFYLRFPPGKPVPSLLALTVNDYDVCRARGAESDALSTISLESALSTGVSGAPQVSGYEFSAAGRGRGRRPDASDPEPPPAPRPHPAPLRARTTVRRARSARELNRHFLPDPFPSESWVEPDTPRPRPKPSPRPSRPAGGSGEPLLDPTKCGVANVPNALVVNGFEAAKGQWPWQAALYAKNETESYNIVFSFQCGGTLVSRRHVVSAAHCVVNLQEKREVQVGGWGRHEGGALSDTLRIARMPVVSQET
ncbi:AAEL002254-PA [Gryllus bimaculatus]|nr:AAEL002254-PA [Gryllus bimaculatus]